MSLSKKCKSPRSITQVTGPIRATQEFTLCPTGVSDNEGSIRRTASLETLNTLKSHTVSTYTQTDENRGDEIRRSVSIKEDKRHNKAHNKTHRRSSSLGNCSLGNYELKEKLRRSLMREKQNVPTSGPICVAHSTTSGPICVAHSVAYNMALKPPLSDRYNTGGGGLLTRTKSMECLNSEIEKITISSSPLSAHTPNDGHKAPLPPSDSTVLRSPSATANSRFTQTPDSDMMYVRRTTHSVTPPEESTSPWETTRSPDSPDQHKIGSSPRVNCSFLFAQRPPSTAAQSTCVRYNIACQPLEPLGPEPLGPDKSKIKIIFSSNSVFNRPGSTPSYRLSPAEQICN